MIKHIRNIFYFLGLSINKLPKNIEIRLFNTINLLYPYKFYNLQRVGPEYDSGYLIPELNKGDLDLIISPGVDEKVLFEEQLALDHKCDVVLIDPDKPSEYIINKSNFKYLEGFLKSNKFSDKEYTLDFIFAKYAVQKSNILLQMDIEGSEYEVILSCKEELLKKFKIIIIEFHYLSNYLINPANEIFQTVLKKLNKNHIPIHIHANNFTSPKYMKGIEIPNCIEVTYINREFFKITKERKDQIYDNELDKPCVCNNKEIYLKSWDLLMKKFI